MFADSDTLALFIVSNIARAKFGADASNNIKEEKKSILKEMGWQHSLTPLIKTMPVALDLSSKDHSNGISTASQHVMVHEIFFFIRTEDEAGL